MTLSDSTSSLAIFSNIFTSPTQAYQDLQKDSTVLFPLLLLIILNVALIFFLFSSIDYSWYVDHMVNLQAGDLSPAQQEAMRANFEKMTPNTISMIAGGSTAIGLPIIYAIYAGYLLVISNLNNDGIGFKRWFSFISWSYMPVLFGVLASFVTIVVSSNGQIAPETLNPLTLNELFFGLDPNKGIGSILAQLDITQFWVLGLMTIGYSKWTHISPLKSFLIVGFPIIAFYSIRILMV